MRLRLLIPVFAFLVAVLPSSAFASSIYKESVSGFETGYPQSTATCPSPNSVSPFTGTAHGTLNGIFTIAVCHTPLSPSATILGGIFTVSNGTTKTISGQFAPGGMVQFVSTDVEGSLCIQTYVVSGALLPAGNFAGTLTHYGYWTGASCSVFFATISGRALLTA